MTNSTPDAAASDAESWTDGTAHPPVESVDRALQLALMLRFGGALTVTEAAARLGVAVSTAHRRLAALSYRGFASQDRERRYVAGPVLAAQAVGAIARRSLPFRTFRYSVGVISEPEQDRTAIIRASDTWMDGFIPELNV